MAPSCLMSMYNNTHIHLWLTKTRLPLRQWDSTSVCHESLSVSSAAHIRRIARPRVDTDWCWSAVKCTRSMRCHIHIYYIYLSSWNLHTRCNKCNCMSTLSLCVRAPPRSLDVADSAARTRGRNLQTHFNIRVTWSGFHWSSAKNSLPFFF